MSRLKEAAEGAPPPPQKELKSSTAAGSSPAETKECSSVCSVRADGRSLEEPRAERRVEASFARSDRRRDCSITLKRGRSGEAPPPHRLAPSSEARRPAPATSPACSRAVSSIALVRLSARTRLCSESASIVRPSRASATMSAADWLGFDTPPARWKAVSASAASSSRPSRLNLAASASKVGAHGSWSLLQPATSTSHARPHLPAARKSSTSADTSGAAMRCTLLTRAAR
mmetsp:Transcript_21699/g.69278  ORF Transcript_21699/g.69278 Transcript_21699/m.69278 type:complete len:230 (-) Transcript_21699:149-838(-)